MTTQEVIIRRIETRVRQLILAYEEEKKANQVLRAEVREMQQLLDTTKQDLVKANHQYQTLLLGRFFQNTSEDVEVAKSRLNNMLGDVNKCIELVKNAI